MNPIIQPARNTHRNSYNAPWYAIHLDNQGHITFASFLAETLLQQPTAALLGQPLSAYITTNDLSYALLDSIMATRENETNFATTWELTCHEMTDYYDLFARYISDSDSFVFMFTPHNDKPKSLQINTTVQQFVNDTLTESRIDNVLTLLQTQLARTNIGVFCLLLQQPININPSITESSMDFTGLWIFGKRIPTDIFASLKELIAFLSSQSTNSITMQQDPASFGELPPELNDLLVKRFMSTGLRAYVTIPLQSNNSQLIGIIGLFSPFKEWIEAIPQSTLSSIHIVITQLYARNHLQAQITRLQRLNHEISTITNIAVNHEFIPHMCMAAQRIFDATHVLFARYQPDTNNFIITDANNPQNEVILCDTYTSALFQTAQRFTNLQSPLPEIFTQISAHINATVIISAPLQRNNMLVGILLITHIQHEFLTQQDVTYAAQFAEFVTSHYRQQQLSNALNESERRYRFLINESSNPIFVVDINDVVIHMNHAARRLMGVDSMDVLLFKSFFSSVLQSEWQEKRQLLESDAQHKLTWQSEITNQLKMQQIPVEIEAQIIKHERNTPEILISIRDIGQQRESERRQTLREQELAMFQHITSIVNSSLDLNVLLERTLDIFDEIQFGHMLGIILINEHNVPFIAAHRHVPADLITQIINSPNIIRGAIDMVLSNYDSQMSIYNTSQESIMTSHLIQNFGNMIGAALSDNGKHIGIILTSRPFHGTTPFTPRDIQILHTVANQLSRAITNARLHQSLQVAAERYINLYEDTEEIRSHLSSIIENSPDILILCNRTTLTMNILNKRPIIMLGYDPMQIQNLDFTILCHTDNQEQFALHIERFKAQSSYSFEFSLLRGDKQPFIGLISTSIVNKHDILVVIKDITPMRQLENRIKQREKLVSLGQMIAGVAHELNNPIAVIRGITQLQLMQSHDEQLLKDLQTIDHTSQRAGRILKQLRSLAQPQISQHIAVDIIQLVHHITSQYQMIFAEAEITCTVHTHPNETYIISGQDAQIEQVFVNLIDNAIHAMRGVNHDRELNISFIATAKIITIFVDDTGSGIDKSARDYIFDPFYTTRKIGEGLGLGLAIVHTIIQQHNGTIMYQHRQGGGTRFIIELPTIHAPRIRVAQQTIATEFYYTICSKIRELTTTPLIEVESIVDQHDLLIIDEQLLASLQDIPTNTVICVISRTTATMPLHNQQGIIRASVQMNELQLKQQMQVLVSLLNQVTTNKE
jgi:PAS domain S-box-containing protein